MNIACKEIAKKFKQELLFSGFDYLFKQGESYALLGPNSSGKSTLLKMIAGVLEPSDGKVEFEDYSLQESHSQIAFTSPEMALLADYTVQDIIDFHFSFKKCKLSLEEFVKHAELKPFLFKPYSSLSSGLKNKLKLALAIFSDVPVLLLDEPCTNFDEANVNWYRNVVGEYCNGQLIIVASNQEIEYHFCKHKINLNSYKS
ncbi:MAG: ATP-binding cassette domain-containing protein [Bacteroidia bacterium]